MGVKASVSVVDLAKVKTQCVAKKMALRGGGQ